LEYAFENKQGKNCVENLSSEVENEEMTGVRLDGSVCLLQVKSPVLPWDDIPLKKGS